MNDFALNASTILDPRPRNFVHPKVTAEHQELDAAVYVRQSTGAQLRDHQESTARQYAMKDRVVALGWEPDNVMVIDDDFGLSGSGSARREGFRRLLKLITDQKLGLVAGLEMSRLARNSKDWSDLFEVCAIFNTLIADEDGVYRSPRHTKPISASMIGKLLADDPACHRQLTEPEPLDDQWLGRDLASAIGVAEKKLKDWVTRGWMIADQRPFGRVWLFWADANELERLRQLSAGQRGQGRPSPPESLRTPQRKVRETNL